MALGLQVGGSSSEITPFIKYDARAGRVFRVDRLQVNGMWESSEKDITRETAFVADLANIKVGWINYTAQGPVKALSVLGKEPIPARPEGVNAEGKPAFRQAFELMLLLSKAAGGGPARALSSAAGCVIEAIDVLHDAYSAAPEAKAGKLPIVKLVDTVSVKAGQSTNYKPIFEITGWADRPEGLPAPAGEPAPRSAPPATGSQTVAPPAAKTPEQIVADADSFG